jgi:hypothetical protein
LAAPKHLREADNAFTATRENMKVGQTRTIRGAMGIAIVCLVGTASVRGQAGPEQNPQLAGDVFTNVPVLGGVPVDEFMDTMGMFSNALNMNCTDCHTANSMDSWDGFAEETPLKQTARRMMAMMNTINRDNFSGARRVTCFTCHRGDQRPAAVAKLSVQYGVPPEDPNAFEVFPGFGTPSIDEVFDTYIQALGGAENLAILTSFVGTGTYSGYDTDFAEVPTEAFVQAPDKLTTVVQGFYGDTVKTFDGRDAWIAAADRPVPLMRLTGGNLDGARIEALLAFPAGIQQAFSQWRVNVTAIDDREVLVAQGTNAGALPVNLYFDDSGLLVRSLRWTETAVGIIPTQVDYADYREVSGVQIPFRMTVTWTNGESATQFSEVQPNVAIDAARFARPAPAAPR